MVSETISRHKAYLSVEVHCNILLLKNVCSIFFLIQDNLFFGRVSISLQKKPKNNNVKTAFIS